MKFVPFTGPVRYTWRDPDSQRLFEEPSKAQLIERIQAYRVQNNLEVIEHLGMVLESYWCGLRENRGRCVPVEVLPRGVMGLVKGGIALAKTILYNKFAHQQVADERSRQCAACPNNVFPDKGVFVQWSNEIAEASTDGRRSAKHDELGECAVCSCPLRAKVFYDGEIDPKPEWIEPMKAVSCWQLKMMK